MALVDQIEQEMIQLGAATTSILQQVDTTLKQNQNINNEHAEVLRQVSMMSTASMQLMANTLPKTQRQFTLWESILGNMTTTMNVALGDIGNIDIDAITSSIQQANEKLNNLQQEIIRKQVDTSNYPNEIKQHEEKIRRSENIIDQLDTKVAAGGTLTPREQTRYADAQSTIRSESRSAKNKQTELEYLQYMKEQASTIRLTISQYQDLIRTLKQHQKSIEDLIPGYNRAKERIENWVSVFSSDAPVMTKMLFGFSRLGLTAAESARYLGELLQKLYSFGREFQIPFDQVGVTVLETYRQSFKSFGEEISFSNKQYGETLRASAQVFGGRFEEEETKRVTQEAARQGVSPNQMLGATFAAYGTLSRSYEGAEASAGKVRDIFKSVGLSGQKAFDYMRNNAYLLAVYGEKFSENIGLSAAKFAKMGLDMQLFKNLADNVVMDFGSFIDKTAELGATIPGLQLDVATLSQKAFMEGPVAVADELQKQLGAAGKNFADLPYFQQVSLRQTLGLDETTLAKLTGTTPLEDIPLKQYDETKKTNDTLDKIAKWLSDNLGKYGGPLGTVAPILEGIVKFAVTIAALGAVAKGSVASIAAIGAAALPVIGALATIAAAVGVAAFAISKIPDAIKDVKEGKTAKGVAKGAGWGGLTGAALGAGILGSLAIASVPLTGGLSLGVLGGAAAIGALRGGQYAYTEGKKQRQQSGLEQPSIVAQPSATPLLSTGYKGYGGGHKTTGLEQPSINAQSTVTSTKKSWYDGIVEWRSPEQVKSPIIPGSGFTQSTTIDASRARPISTTTNIPSTPQMVKSIDENLLSQLTATAVAKALSNIKFNVMPGDVVLDGTKVGTQLAGRLEYAALAHK